MKKFDLNFTSTNTLNNLLLIFIMLPLFANANKVGTPYSIFDQMNYQEVLDIKLDVDLNALIQNRHSEEDYLATLSFTDANGDLQEWNTEVTLRGKYRRMRCTEMPPLKLKFKKGDLAAVGLSSSNDLKLVTQCVEDEQEAKALLLKEYLAYKIYNEITDVSYRVQLVRVTYNDTSTGERKKQWAFLIEDTAQLRQRVNADKCKDCLNMSIEKFKQEEFKIMAVFQYMIGNADWSASAAKNTKLIKTNDHILAIPYDFDFSGMVNASYATANSNYHLNSKKDRIYLGFDKHLDSIATTFDYFLNKKSQIIDLVKKFKWLNTTDRREVINYIKAFYEEGALFKTKETYLELLANKQEVE